MRVQPTLEWLLFLEQPEPKLKAGVLKPSWQEDTHSDRKRLLFWAFPSTVLWSHLSHTLLNFALMVTCPVILSLAMTWSKGRSGGARGIAWSAGRLAVVLVLISLVTIATSQAVYLRLESIVVRVVLREYNLFKCWCPHVTITLFSITAMTCYVRSFNRRSILKQSTARSG